MVADSCDLHLPKSTEINKFVAKTNFYKRANIAPKIHNFIEQQVDRITWANKVAPTTMNISSGEVVEFQVFHIQLKTPDLDNAVPIFIQKSVPYPILFVISGARGVRVIAVTKNADSKPVIIATDWKPSLSLELKGNSTDTIYKNYLIQLSPSFAAVGGDTDKHSEATRIKRGIDALSSKIKRETQINKRQELARERYELETKLKGMIG
ncbi:DUF4391 family protein [Candidatus Saccharibacteria bacterium]|nr:DUF4391 family protein [Candidatus Saccharibacteria bacterium]